MSYTGPTSRVLGITWPNRPGFYQYYRDQSIYKTVPGTRRKETPYNGSLKLFDGESKYGPGVVNYESCNSNSNQDPIGRVVNDYYGLKPRALNRARSKFITSMKESRETSIGASIFESDQALRMIGDRAKQLFLFARQVKRGNFRGASSVIGAPKGFKPKAKSFGGAFLEYHFGWSPLLGDIHDGMKLISQPLPSDGKVRGRGRSSAYQALIKSYDSGGTYPDRKFLSGTFVSYCEIRGQTELVNPNLDLLQTLGLVNPLEIAWELVPFSFLVDHVVGIGDFLHSFSDEFGWKVTDVGVSQLQRLLDGTFRYDRAIGASYAFGTAYSPAVCVTMSRTLSVSLPPYSLEFTNPFTGLSAPRAATYIALLLQVLN